jgi:hypothetical protein
MVGKLLLGVAVAAAGFMVLGSTAHARQAQVVFPPGAFGSFKQPAVNPALESIVTATSGRRYNVAEFARDAQGHKIVFARNVNTGAWLTFTQEPDGARLFIAMGGLPPGALGAVTDAQTNASGELLQDWGLR